MFLCSRRRYKSTLASRLLAKGDLIIMSRARKGVISERKGVTPQGNVGSDSSSELLAKIVAVMEEKFLGFGKRLDSISECLEKS